MVLHLTHVEINYLPIAANWPSIYFDIVLTGALQDFVVVGETSDAVSERVF